MLLSEFIEYALKILDPASSQKDITEALLGMAYRLGFDVGMRTETELHGKLIEKGDLMTEDELMARRMRVDGLQEADK